MGTAWRARGLVVFVSSNAVARFFAARPAGAAWPRGPARGRARAGHRREPARARRAGGGDRRAGGRRAAARLRIALAAAAAARLARPQRPRGARRRRPRLAGRAARRGRRHGRRGRRLPAARAAALGRGTAPSSTPPSPRRRATPGCSAAPRPIAHLEALDGVSIAPGSRALATHPRIAARARQAGFDRGLRGAARPRCGGRLHTIDATVNDDSSPAAEPRTVVSAPVAAAPPRGPLLWRWSGPIVLLLTIVSVLALALAWRADQRVRSSERELVKRQQDSADRVAEALLLARQAQDAMREATAKVALLEARLGEVALQRGQLEELVRSVARSRDENLVSDIEAAMRAAVQQSALTGSAEPLVATLKQSDERLARANQPRLEPIRRAIARDLDRAKASSVADVATLSIKVDEVVRMVDELPLLSASEPRRDLGAEDRPSAPEAPAPGGRRLGARRPGRPGVARARPGRPLLRRQHLVGDPLAGADHADRPSGGDAGRAGPGLLPAREPEAAPAQRPPGADGAPVRRRPGRPEVGPGRDRALLQSRLEADPDRRRDAAPGRRSRRAAPASPGPTTRSPRSPPPAPR